MSFKEDFAKIQPREKGGATAQNRFGFQGNWALSYLIELYDVAYDFIMIFEYHDDIVIIKSDNNVDKASFIQVKTDTSKSSWTIDRLLKKEPVNSFIGKLYQHVVNFKDNVEELRFVSNIGFSIKDSSMTSVVKDFVKIGELDQAIIDSVNERVKSELILSTEPTCEMYLNLIKTDLTPRKHEEITKGTLSKFLEDLCSGIELNLSSVYSTIKNEILQRSANECGFKSFDDLASKKGISKELFRSWVLSIVNSKNLHTFELYLKNYIMDFPYADIKKFNESLNSFRLYKLKYICEPFNRFLSDIRKYVEQKSDLALDLKGKDLLDFFYVNIDFEIDEEFRDEYLVKIAMLEVIYGE